MFDDISFYIGDEDFYTSKSVCDSDISQTDSEADDDDDCDWLLDDQSAGHSVSESPRAGLANASSEHDCIDNISFYITKEQAFCSSDSACKNESSVAPSAAAHDDDSDCQSDGQDNWCQNKSLDESMRTGMTMAYSDADSSEDASFYCRSRSVQGRDVVSEIGSEDDDDDDDDYKNFLSFLNDDVHQSDDEYSLVSVLSSQSETFEDFLSCHGKEESLCTPRQSVRGQTKSRTLDDILYNPLYFSALLIIMAHDPKKRDSRFCETHEYGQDAVPVI